MFILLTWVKQTQSKHPYRHDSGHCPYDRIPRCRLGNVSRTVNISCRLCLGANYLNLFISGWATEEMLRLGSIQTGDETHQFRQSKDSALDVKNVCFQCVRITLILLLMVPTLILKAPPAGQVVHDNTKHWFIKSKQLSLFMVNYRDLGRIYM